MQRGWRPDHTTGRPVIPLWASVVVFGVGLFVGAMAVSISRPDPQPPRPPIPGGRRPFHPAPPPFPEDPRDR